MRSRILFNRFFEGVRPELWIYLFLVVAILVIYLPVGGYEFINYDDPQYVADNDPVKKGLTFEGIRWAFTSLHASNWHPITWLSHMLDVQMYGVNAGAHHLTNVLFHMLNSMLLFLLLHRMTGALWRSAMVAALFAVHPLHVESVAWISERKDVLSAFFGFLTLLAYAEYIKRPGWLRYGAALLFFALGLMSKPMVVTLPFLMLVLDYWPLNRYAQESGFLRFAFLVKEKLPFFALSGVSCAVTVIAQSRGGAMSLLESYSFGMRLANALVAYVAYLGKMIWPMNLAILYPHPGMRPLWQIIGAVVVISGISTAAVLWARRRPWFAVGWLWYLGTLIPVIGLVQVGYQRMADRYAYIPLLGIYIVLAWGFHEIFHRRWYGMRALAVAGMVVSAALMLLTWHQVKCWKNSTEIFSCAIRNTTGNFVAHNNLGVALSLIGNHSDAIVYYREAVNIFPNYADAHNNLGTTLIALGEKDAAIDHFRKAFMIRPQFPQAHNNFGSLLAEHGRIDEAISHFRKALELDPALKLAEKNLETALKEKSNHSKDIQKDSFEKAVKEP